MADGGSKKGLYTGVAVGGCLVLLCCGFLPIMSFAGYYVWMQRQARMWEYEWGNWETDSAWNTPATFEDVAWGEIRLTRDPTNIYTNNSTTAVVAETRGKGDKVDYYGFDDTSVFFKVKTSEGPFGYVYLDDAEMEVYLGQIRVISESVYVYESNSTGSNPIEKRVAGDLVDWYGFDATGDFYKVRTAGGSDGYVRVTDAEIPW